MNPDTPENRIYIQRNRLWLLGEVIVMKLMREQPADPIATAVAVLEAEAAKPTDHIDPPTPEDAQNAKPYLQQHNIAMLIEAWFKETLEAKPEKPLPFSITFFKKQQRGGGAAAAADSSAASAKAGEEAAASPDSAEAPAAAADADSTNPNKEPVDDAAAPEEENLMDEL